MLWPETTRTLPDLISVTYTGVVVVVVVIVAVTCWPGFRSATPMSFPSNWNLKPSGIVYSVALPAASSATTLLPFTLTMTTWTTRELVDIVDCPDCVIFVTLGC